MLRLVTAAVIAALSVTTAGAGSLESALALGKAEYSANCASCHGDAGRGDGPIAYYFKDAVPDLTMIKARNDKVYPFSDVYAAIDGRKMYPAHGLREMPVWGKAFKLDESLQGASSNMEGEAIVQGRILSLVYYLQSIQE